MLLFILFSLIYSQDPPLGFEYNQGTEQGFYFFQNITIDGQILDDDDWIGSFKRYFKEIQEDVTDIENTFDNEILQLYF